MNELTVLIVDEKTAFQSIMSDVFTFSCLFGGFFLNYHYLGNSVILKLLFGFFVVLILKGRANKKIKKMSPEEALEYLAQKGEK